MFGVGSQATALNATAIGFNSLADEANAVFSRSRRRRKTYYQCCNPTKATDAANKGYVDSQIAAIPTRRNCRQRQLRSCFNQYVYAERRERSCCRTGKDEPTLTSVAGITVTSTSLNMDDIDSFTVDGVQETDLLKSLPLRMQRRKAEGNIAVGSYSSAVSTANTASGSYGECGG
ncbi:MAG: hypothetical protein U1F01_03135 [Acinetobacter sp.]